MLSNLETGKDTVQIAVESAATRVGRIVTIIATAVADVTREIGGWATDIFEMLEASQRAKEERQLAKVYRLDELGRTNLAADPADGAGRPGEISR